MNEILNENKIFVGKKYEFDKKRYSWNRLYTR